jgi:hypothetical protein
MSLFKKVFGKKVESNEAQGDGHPIPSELLNRLDLTVKLKDGGVILKIIAAGYLDESGYTQRRVYDKIMNYLEYIHSGDFEKEFGAPSFEKTHIRLVCSEDPASIIVELVQAIQKQVDNCSISILGMPPEVK